VIEGKKLILIMFAIVIAIAIVSYILYLSTRLDHDFPRDDEGLVGPNAVEGVAAPDYHLTA
jgi:hypothetical protein